MSFDDVFKKENLRLIFEPYVHECEYIAEALDAYTVFGNKHSFGRDWAYQFDSGRYVIILYKRHSLYIGGERIFINKPLEKDELQFKPRYAIILDKAMEYNVPSWGRSLTVHTLHDENNPLQIKIFRTIDEAEQAALNYSKLGYKAAVMVWCESYDMY